MPAANPTAIRTALALKEWSAVAHALLAGRQSVLLRKGGIHERAFTGALAPAFALLPTVAHSHAERVRPEHRDLLEPAALDVSDGAVTVRCGVRVVADVAVSATDRLGDIADLHIWTDESVAEDRVAFRPRHPLHAIVVDVVPLAAPVRLARGPELGGCRSWVDVPLAWDVTAPGVFGADQLAEAATRVRRLGG